MKKRNLPVLLTICLGILAPVMFNGQNLYVKQIITANGGKFEFVPPYQDFVTLQSYNPVSGAVNIFQSVFTQSVQDVLIKGNIAYVAAQDSIIKLNLDTYQRIAAVADSGLNKLYLIGNRLVVSKQYPVTTFFAEVLDTTDLSLVISIPGISGDCGSMVKAGDSLYLTVNGGWMGTEGKIAVIETTGWTVTREINLGTEAVGMLSIFLYNNKLFTVNKSPFQTPETGSISSYNLVDYTFINTVINKNIGFGAGIDGHLLYFGLNYGIGSFNLNTLQIEDSVVVPDPGSALFKYITSATIDTLNNHLYINIGDYVAAGTCLVATLTGDSVTSFATGISSDAVTVDYREAPAGIENKRSESMLLTLYPNPVSERLTVKLLNQQAIKEILITDMMGRAIMQKYTDDQKNSSTIMVNNLPAGLYSITVKTSEISVKGKFMKK